MNAVDAMLESMGPIPHQEALGFELVETRPDFALGAIPYTEDLVGNPGTGVLHGGVVTTLLDTVGGVAVIARLERQVTMATLDLRIDYLRPARPRERLWGRVECFHVTRNVAFARGVAYEESPADPVAAMSATYMLDTPSHRSRERPGSR